jgi:hypothetical protein
MADQIIYRTFGDKRVPVRYHDNLDGSLSEQVFSQGGGGGAAGFGETLVKPTLADFTWQNQGISTAADTSYGIFVVPQQGINAGTVIRALLENAPGQFWRLEAFVGGFLFGTAAPAIGICGYETSSGRYVTFGFLDDGTGSFLQGARATVNNHDGDYFKASAPGLFSPRGNWIAFEFNGKDLIFEISVDGANWFVFATAPNIGWVSQLDKVGFFADCKSGSGQVPPIYLASFALSTVSGVPTNQLPYDLGDWNSLHPNDDAWSGTWVQHVDWYKLNDPYVAKTFICEKTTTAISVEYVLFNQWFGTGQNGGLVGQYCQVLNNTKATQERHDYVNSSVSQQTYHHRQQFNVASDPGDIIEVRFISPDPGNAGQKPQVRNVKVFSDALGDAELG